MRDSLVGHRRRLERDKHTEEGCVPMHFPSYFHLTKEEEKKMINLNKQNN